MKQIEINNNMQEIETILQMKENIKFIQLDKKPVVIHANNVLTIFSRLYDYFMVTSPSWIREEPYGSSLYIPTNVYVSAQFAVKNQTNVHYANEGSDSLFVGGLYGFNKVVRHHYLPKNEMFVLNNDQIVYFNRQNVYSFPEPYGELDLITQHLKKDTVESVTTLNTYTSEKSIDNPKRELRITYK